MSNRKVENLVGALSLAIVDDLLREAQHNVSLSAPAASITLIGHAPGLTIDQLSRTLGLSHPGAVRLVDRLVQKGLVVRNRSTSDGRAVALSLSASGEELSQSILASRQSALSRAVAALSAVEQKTLGDLVEKLLRKMVKDEDHALQVCRLCDPAICEECPVEAEILSRVS